MSHQKLTQSAVWDTADKHLRNVVEPHEYGDYILPFTVLRRIECVLEPTKQELLDEIESLKAREVARGERDADADNAVPLTSGSISRLDSMARHGLQLPFYNTSTKSLKRIAQTDDALIDAMEEYLSGFSEDIDDIWVNFEFSDKIHKLDAEGILLPMIRHFASLDLSPETMDEYSMGDLFENLMYRSFSLKGAGAGAFYTPRDAVALAVDVLLASDDHGLTEAGARPVRSVYDPTAGTGGMLIFGAKGIKSMNPNATVDIFGQEKMPVAYATGKSDILIAGGRPDSVRKGNTLLEDLYEGMTFDYVLSNPPFGSDWSNEYESVLEESAVDGTRFGHGLPSKSDGQSLFMCHVAHKLRPAGPDGQGGRGAVFSNGSPLFTGAPESGPDSIRKWLLTSDLVDCIIQLPTNIFYGTGISTYVWILDTNKEDRRKGYIQLIDGSECWQPMAKGMGDKRREISESGRLKILAEYQAFENTYMSRIVTANDLGFKDVPVKRQARLRVVVTDESRDQVRAHEKGGEEYVALLDGLDGLGFAELEKTLKARAKGAGLKLPATLKKDIIAAITVHDPEIEPVIDKKGKPVLDPLFSMTERIPLSEDVDEHMEREVVPFASDVVWDESKAKTGYEIPFTRIFYKPEPVRDLDEIDADVQRVMGELAELFESVKE
ncbi:DNA restriction-modification system, DNA methylase [Corynebacterium frankenforstense DSM 45800]|uniref:site-specific DNA-methyltransferase (adenine-specific) n=1 Tax=Corynebacterium frankenforstense DSM 45800 TaxID=1437875 RepID=A0A1L7CQ94_9CORY|nr:class I SAM-dependent DNA methyltransferase [Corynebacterium frankenforstense]APT88014.1 DNA restriction-modification system, DNA methylase [Corynebacterium frankenforstense DSM 45800]